MKIGILGVGHIGQTLAQKLSAARHQVKVANSRGPETIDETSLLGARAVNASETVDDVEVVILSIPLKRIVDAVPLLAGLPDETVIIDTSNYYPLRDGEITAIEKGQVESLWVAEQIGRPIVKAWNAIGAGSFATQGKPKGSHDRIAIPIAAERPKDSEIAMSLVDDTGLDAFDAGSLADSWRLQPGSPAYCTDLKLEDMATALEAAERVRLPKRRDLAVAVIQERLESRMGKLEDNFVVRLNRLIYM